MTCSIMVVFPEPLIPTIVMVSAWDLNIHFRVQYQDAQSHSNEDIE